MRKLIFSVGMLLAVMVFAASGAFAAANVRESEDIKIVIDSKEKDTANVPILVNGRTMLPLREIATQLGVSDDEEHIKWDSVTKDVYISKDNTVINLEINNKIAQVNGTDVELDVEPIIYANRTYIPVRFVSQSFGKKVIWDSTTRSVFICNAEEYNKVKEIMDGSSKAMESLKKYKFDFVMDMNAKGKDDQKLSVLKVDMKAQLDLDKKKSNMNMDMVMLSIMNMSMQSYMDDNVVYSKDSLTNKWTKETKTTEEALAEFSEIYDISSFENSEVISAGLKVAESKNADEIVLNGDVMLAELTETMGSSLIKGNDLFGKDSKFELNITIDKNTNYIKKIDMVLSGKLSDEDDFTSGLLGSSTYNATVVCNIYDVNGSFEVEKPADLDISKVEEKSSDIFDFGDLNLDSEL